MSKLETAKPEDLSDLQRIITAYHNAVVETEGPDWRRAGIASAAAALICLHAARNISSSDGATARTIPERVEAIIGLIHANLQPSDLGFDITSSEVGGSA